MEVLIYLFMWSISNDKENKLNFAYLIDGTVTGLNRAGQGSEITGNCTSQDLTNGMVAGYYTAPAGVLTPMTAGEIGDVDAYNTWSAMHDEYMVDGRDKNQTASEVINFDLVQVDSGLKTLTPEDKALVVSYLSDIQIYLVDLNGKVYPDSLVPPPTPPITDYVVRLFL